MEQREQRLLRGATETNSINTLVQSGRNRMRAEGKRTRVGPSRMGLAMFQHCKVDEDDFEKRAFADSDIALFTDLSKQPPFFGFVAINEDPSRDDAFITVAVGGRVNVLNTSIWPIYAFDRVYVLIQKRGTGLGWKPDFFNPNLDHVTDCALVCSKYNYDNMIPATAQGDYEMFDVGFALTNERCVKSSEAPSHRSVSHLFSLHMDVFKPRP